MTPIPPGVHVTYRQQYIRCGKTPCAGCVMGKGHGPYWYAYWYEGGKLKTGYIGKTQGEPERRVR